jgi:hypothetical protein
MNLIFTLLCTFAIGYFVRPRRRALAAYLIADSLLITIQTVNLVMEWADGSDAAFGQPFEFVRLLEYAAVNLAIVLVGVGLVVAGGAARGRRAARRGRPAPTTGEPEASRSR